MADIELIAGFQPKNGLDFDIVQAKDVGYEGKKLSAVLAELKSGVAAGLKINDEAASSTETYSSSKIDSQITTARTELKAEILGGVSEAYDTLKELADLATDNESLIANLTQITGKQVRVDTAQDFTVEEKKQARSNINAASPEDVAVAKSAADAAQNTADTNATNIGTLSSLKTTEKTTIVGAANELKLAVDANAAAAAAAQAQADKGVQDAATAQTAAEGAQSTADTAVKNAATAQSAAEGAQSTADQGVKDAAAAKSAADDARGDIDALTAAVGATDTDFVAVFEAALTKSE